MPTLSRRSSRLVGSALGLTLAVGLTAAVPPAPVHAHPGVPAAIFDANTVGWATWRDMSLNALDTKVLEYRNEGYLVVDLDLDTEGAAVKASVVAQKNTDDRDWWIFDDLTAAQYTAKQAAATAAGLRQTDVETYLLGGVRRYGAVWVENKENLSGAAKRDLTSAELTTFETQQRAAGRLPVAVDSYLDGGTVKYAAVFVQNTAGLTWHLHQGLTDDAYGDVFDSLGATHRVVGIDSVETASTQLYTGIFWQNTNGRSWRQLRDMTEQSYLNNLWRSRDEGFRAVAFERYDTAAGVRYAAVWRENGSRYDWPLRGKVNAAVQKQLDDFDVPGISVAVMQGGVVKYSRGFGHADVGANVWMDSKHVLGLASVSKGVAGVLTLKLAELGRVGVNERLDQRIPTVPAHHAATTLKNLADNRGCVMHYLSEDGIGDFGDNNPYATSLAAARDFWNFPRWVRPQGTKPADVPACAVGKTYHYSTHGYTLLCAALEQADNRNTVDLIEDRLTTPYGLGTLKAEQVGDTSVRRSRVYNSKNAAFTLPDRSEKYCGGGMEASAPDLASFGHKLLTDKIFTVGKKTTRDQLWPRPAADRTSYSYGWDMANPTSAAGIPHFVAAKSGANSGARSYLRIYPDDDIVIAVLSNRQNRQDAQGNTLPTHNMTRLGTDIGTLIIDELDN